MNKETKSFSTANESTFCWVKIIEEISYEIIGSQWFKSAFINRSMSLK